MQKQIISTDKAPKAIGPYSQATKVGNFIFTSGQIPLNPGTGEVGNGDIKEQTKQVLENLKEVLAASGAGLENVVKTTVFISDMNEFALINEVYAQYFTGEFPSRSCVQVARLPKDVGVEIEAVAVLP